MRKKSLHPKVYRISHERLCEINSENSKRGVEVRRQRKLEAIATGRKPPHTAMCQTAIYAEDRVTLMRYARQEGRIRVELLHELIAPLKEKIKGLPRVDPNDPWLNKPEEEY